MTTSRKIRHRLEYLATLGTGFLLCLLPYPLALFVADRLGELAFSVFRVRRKVSLNNLKNSFGTEFSNKQIKKIAQQSYRNIAKSVVEYSRSPILKGKKALDLVEFQGLENFDWALKQKKGAIIVAGHFGSWELMGAATAQKGYPIDFLVGEQHNLLVDNMMNKYRQMMGIGIIKMGVAAKGVIKAVRGNRMVAMLSDQDAGNDGTFVNFLGRPASTPKGPAAFALKTDAPIIMAFIIREKSKKQKIILEKPIHIEKSGDKEKDIQNLTQAYTSMLEQYIRKYPDHWFWPHRRWKSTVRE
jgi:KDO2-lipid IV(A) lauroyltransferase